MLASEVKSRLRQLVRDSHETDLLVIYFAGHNLVPQWGYGTSERYLVTPDLDESGLLDNPEAGLRMSFLTSDVLEHFNGTSVLILDCCQAGSLATFRSGSALGTGVDENTRRTVLAACSADGYAREDVDAQHGAFTHLVLQGLAGGAADSHGLVTFETLSTYVREQNLEPAPVMALQGQSTILLTRPSIDRPSTKRTAAHALATATPLPLENPLDHLQSDLIRLVDHLARKARTANTAKPSDMSPAKVELIQSALGAAAVAYIGRTDSAHAKAPNSSPLMPLRHLTSIDSNRRSGPTTTTAAHHAIERLMGTQLPRAERHSGACRSDVRTTRRSSSSS